MTLVRRSFDPEGVTTHRLGTTAQDNKDRPSKATDRNLKKKKVLSSLTGWLNQAVLSIPRTCQSLETTGHL